MVLQDGELQTFLDQECLARRAAWSLRPTSSVGRSLERPNGLKVQVEKGLEVHLEAVGEASEAWKEAISRTVQGLQDMQRGGPIRGASLRVLEARKAGCSLKRSLRPLENLGLRPVGCLKALCPALFLSPDCLLAARGLVSSVLQRCCNSPQRLANRRLARGLLRGVFRRLAEQHVAQEVSKVGGDRLRAVEAVRRNSGLLRHMPQALRADREVLLAAVEVDPMALAYADESLRPLRGESGVVVGRSDRALVFQAVSQDGMALEHCSEDIKALRLGA